MKKKGFRSLSWQGQLILIVLVICAVLFTPTTMILLVGMLPTFIATYADRTKEKMRGMTIGAMNMAGCTPFIMELWSTEHTPDMALSILSDPLTLVIMYAAAAIGYCIEWAIVGSVSIFVVERAQIRIKQLNTKQETLKKRWGEEVSGDMLLDEFGFPVKEEKKPENSEENS